MPFDPSRYSTAVQEWDPFAFIDYCEEARRGPDSELERIALRVQRAEWQILFGFCAGSRTVSAR